MKTCTTHFHACDCREARFAEIEKQRGELLAALQRSAVALDDWLNTYASELCDVEQVAEARARISEAGTLAYIADVQQQNRAAIAKDIA